MTIPVPLPEPKEGRLRTVLDSLGEPGELPNAVVITAVFGDGQVHQVPLGRDHATALMADLTTELATPLPTKTAE